MMYKSITEDDRRQAIIQKRIFQEIRRLDQSALMSLLKNKEGRWFLMRMLDATGINSNSFTGNSTTFFNEVKRQVGLELLGRITELSINAVKLKQKAVLAYLEHQLRARELVVEHTVNQEGRQ